MFCESLNEKFKIFIYKRLDKGIKQNAQSWNALIIKGMITANTTITWHITIFGIIVCILSPIQLNRQVDYLT